MEDMERYGDYNDVEYDSPKKSGAVLTVLKIITAVVCISVIGILAFRMTLFNTYPERVKNIYFNDTLTEYYEACGGAIAAETQVLRASYDDPDLGNFFCDNLIVIKGVDQLQVSLKYNVSTIERISAELYEGAPLDDMSTDIFTFRLVDNYGAVYSEVEMPVFEARVMYRYAKLVFDGVDFDGSATGHAPEWIRLEIFTDKSASEPYAMICVYENNEAYNVFTTYELSKDEVPNG